MLRGILKRIGNYKGMDDFNDRLILQKTVYLLQSFDLFIGYKFSWYIHGPYCADLTKDGYALGIIDNDSAITVFSSPRDEEKFNQFFKFIGDNKYNPSWLEIISSIHFLRKVHPDLTKGEILNTVKNKQPHFTMIECIDGWDYIEKWQGILK